MLSEDVTAEQFRQSMRRMASTVCVISCRHAEARYGITVTSVTPLSFSPLSVLTCINRNSSISLPLKEEGRYCINLLRATQADVSNSFSGGRPSESRFDVGEWLEKDRVPYLPDAQANLFCSVDKVVSYATHDIIIGNIEEAAFAPDVAPLVYQNGSYALTCPIGLQEAG